MIVATPYQFAYLNTVQAAIQVRPNFWRFMESIVQEAARREDQLVVNSGSNYINTIANEALKEVNKERKRGLKQAIVDLERAYRQGVDFNTLLGDIGNDEHDDSQEGGQDDF